MKKIIVFVMATMFLLGRSLADEVIYELQSSPSGYGSENPRGNRSPDFEVNLGRGAEALRLADSADCHEKKEKERRVFIEKTGLPTDLRFQSGYTKNKWGDIADRFCYLSYQNKAYIFWVDPFYKPSRPVKTIDIR